MQTDCNRVLRVTHVEVTDGISWLVILRQQTTSLHCPVRSDTERPVSLWNASIFFSISVVVKTSEQSCFSRKTSYIPPYSRWVFFLKFIPTQTFAFPHRWIFCELCGLSRQKKSALVLHEAAIQMSLIQVSCSRCKMLKSWAIKWKSTSFLSAGVQSSPRLRSRKWR